MKQLDNLFKKTPLKRRLFFFLTDIILISFSMYASFWLRFNGAIPTPYKESLFYFIVLAVALKLVFFLLFRLYDISWSYVGLEDIFKIFRSLSLGSLSLVVLLFLLRPSLPFTLSPFPRSILVVDFIFSLILVGSFRISKRALQEGVKITFKPKKDKARILIIGAGNAGEQIIREMVKNKDSRYSPVGFIDDDPAKLGVKIHGVKVLGDRRDIPRIIKNSEIHEVLIALPSAHSREIKNIMEIVRQANMVEKIKILPSLTDLMDGKVTLADIHEVKLEDLLGRDPIKIDLDAIRDFIRSKKVLITGAGGSIGSELARTVLQFEPDTLIALDIDDTDIFHLLTNLKFSQRDIIPVIGDIRDESKMAAVFEEFTPQIVIHSAAYKHVPILEFFPEEAVKTNIQGTKILAELSLKHDVEKFIFISTDKAVNPTSVMGTTKRAGEELLKALNAQNKTKCISVRFGNVLGSRGSVIPLFKEQIKKGDAVTVTHPEMKRYFMVTSEAVLLVLEASALGQGGEVYVLDMGEPIKILDLAREMIRLSGFEPDKDIPVVFSNMRPGEKLYEEILTAEEGVESTNYEKILKARCSKELDVHEFMIKIEKLIQKSYQRNSGEEIIELLKEIVPTYRPYRSKQPKLIW